MDVLEADLPEPDLDGIEAILVDEKSVRRKHNPKNGNGSIG